MFKIQDLSALSYSNGFTLWHYRTQDVLEGHNFLNDFGPAHRMVKPGDFILVNFGIGTETPGHMILVVSKVDIPNQGVDVHSLTGIIKNKE